MRNFILILCAMTAAAANLNITNLQDKHYVLIKTDTVYTYQKSDYLYHTVNLTQILQPYELLTKTRINQLIEGNNKQKIINSQFERILEQLPTNTWTDFTILDETVNELNNLLNTINFAQNNNFYSGTLNLDEAKEIIKHEHSDLPVINIMEYSEIHIARVKQIFIIIYKYPEIKNSCKGYQIIPLATNKGKYVMDKYIAKCKGTYTRLENCKNIVSNFICRQTTTDNCTIPTLDNRKATCNLLMENNPTLLDLGNGNIIVDKRNTINNLTIEGINLVQFEKNITINGKIYYNLKEKINEALHGTHNEELTILELFKSNTEYKFSNLEEISTIFIPVEQHPVAYISIIIGAIIVLILILLIIKKSCNYCNERAKKRTKQRLQELYEIELERLQAQDR